MQQVKDNSNLFRDPNNKAIINKNKKAAERARAAKNKFKKDQDRINSLETDLSDIKKLLTQLLEK